MRTIRAILVVMLFCLPSHADPPKSKPASNWVATWGTAPQLVKPGNMPPQPGIALPAGGAAIKSDSDKPLTFHGNPSVTIPQGALIVSDPVDFDLAPLSDLAITIHVTDPTKAITGHPGSRTTSYLVAGDSVTAADLPGAAHTDHWYYVDGIEVVAPKSAAAAIVVGDSITDGRGSTTNGNGRWPDVLARRLQSNKRTRNVAVINQGIGGNRVLNDGLGPSVLARLDRDVLAQPGARWVIVFEGINDLGTHSVQAADLIAAYEQIVIRCRAKGLLVYGATVMPCGESFYFTQQLEEARQAVNNWIRTSGEFDAVIDFDVATRDPDRPTHLSAAVDGGDHLHSNDAGYKIMADSIDLKLFGR